MSERHRRSIRLKEHDYALGGHYYITICVQDRASLLGTIVDGKVHLSECGEVVQGPELPSHYPHVLLDTFIFMPNHIHGIIALEENGDVGAGLKPAPTLPGDGRHALPEIIRGLKTFSSRSINKLRGTPGQRVWQRNYYERVIQSEEELWRVRDYIERNPSQWASDGENPERVRATLMRAGFNPPLQTTSNRYSTTG